MYKVFIVLMLLDEPRQRATFMFEFLVDVRRIHQMQRLGHIGFVDAFTNTG